MAKILLVDDDTTFCLMLKTWLTKRGFEVENAFSCREALAKLKGTKYDVVLTDLRLPDEDGIYLLKNIKASTPEVQVILMTGYADIQTAVLAMKLGAFDYVAKPVIPDEILKKIQDTLEQTAVPEQKKRTKKPQSVPYIKGTSLEADKLYEYIRLVAPTMMTVLITGESGSGKEYIARLIHAQSNRKEAPFIAVDCGAIPKDLAASEFFGHVKGAFTGAVNDKTGYFVAASGGTIFLDEIGNLSYDVQVQLLRALEERKVKPVGSDKEIAFDVRIISATNENLTKAVAEGNFREDLYHRLNEFSLKALSLRERKEDIPVFANGDILTVDDAIECLELSGADGVAVGRGAIGDPTLIARIAHYLKTGEKIPVPPLEERVEMLKFHLDEEIKLRGENVAIKFMRKFYPYYLAGFKNAKVLRSQLVIEESYDKIMYMLNNLSFVNV